MQAPILTATEVRRLLELLLEVPGSVEGEHLIENDFASYREGDLGEGDIERIDQHLAACEPCAIRMERNLAIRRHVGVPAEEEFSFDHFMAEVEPKVKRLLTVYRIPDEDTENILQQSSLALLHEWEEVVDPESWLLGTVRRHCHMYWRANRRRIYSAVDAVVLEWLSGTLSPSQDRSDFLSDLESLIDRLPLRCRTLLRLRFQLGYGPQEVADKLGYSASSIGKITNRCLTALSRELLASGRAESLLNTRSPAAEDDAKDPQEERGPDDGEAKA
ncbi:MAG TPA: sigma-70 family RNA polymerase sigma factor [Thermoanaerobaculia bacterium]